MIGTAQTFVLATLLAAISLFLVYGLYTHIRANTCAVDALGFGNSPPCGTPL
jgi:hypothetical protein